MDVRVVFWRIAEELGLDCGAKFVFVLLVAGFW